jgi:methylmalonyl-CoA mutase N-terminal domain/subunit
LRRIPTIRRPRSGGLRVPGACAPSGKHNALTEKLIAVAKDAWQNIMPITIAAVENGATMGEIVDALKKLWGTYRELPVF